MNSSYLFLAVLGETINVITNSKCPVPFGGHHLLPNTWQHLCLAVADGNMTIYFENETLTSQEGDVNDCSFPIALYDNITVKLSVESTKFTYSGKMTGVRYYDRQLTTSEIKSLTSCENSAQDYVQITNVIQSGNVSTYNLTKQQELCLPEPTEFVALFPICGDHPMAKDFCTKVEGRLINKDDNLDDIAKEIVLSQEMDDINLFLWTEDMDDPKHAVVLSVNRLLGIYHKVIYNTDAIFTITACIMPLKKTVYQKGNTTAQMSLYMYNGKLMLLSDYGLVIRTLPCPKKPEFKCLISRILGMTIAYAILNPEESIFGRKSWTIDGINDSYSYSLTLCGKDQFTCNDGSCIALQSRCNALPDCNDNSDEGELCNIMKPLPPSYWKQSCPEHKPVIRLYLHVLGVSSVSLNTNEIKAKLVISRFWRDQRLTFQNLHEEAIELEDSDSNSIWRPQLVFPGAAFDDNIAIRNLKSVLTHFTVEAKGNGTQEVDNSYEGESLFLTNDHIVALYAINFLKPSYALYVYEYMDASNFCGVIKYKNLI